VTESPGAGRRRSRRWRSSVRHRLMVAGARWGHYLRLGNGLSWRAAGGPRTSWPASGRFRCARGAVRAEPVEPGIGSGACLATTHSRPIITCAAAWRRLWAQLMRYYAFPASGIGVVARSVYVDDVAQVKSTRGGDGSGGPYNWSLMPYNPAGCRLRCGPVADDRRAVHRCGRGGAFISRGGGQFGSVDGRCGRGLAHRV